MKLIFAAALLAYLMSPVAFGQPANKNNDGEFKTLIDRYFAAWSSLNPDNAAPLYAKNPDLFFKGGGQTEMDGRHTAIWERRGGKWLIVHEHVSAPLP